MSAKERGDQNAVVDALRSIQPAVFIPASVVIVAMIVVSVVYSSVAENAFVRLNSAITGGVGWWYILVATGFVVFALYCGISRIGTIRLGRDDELPSSASGHGWQCCLVPVWVSAWSSTGWPSRSATTCGHRGHAACPRLLMRRLTRRWR